MPRKPKRRRVRMLLGQWGSMPAMVERLGREHAAARAWAQAEPGGAAAQLEAHIAREIADLTRLRECISTLVAHLTPEAQRVLILRYETGLSWVQIGLRLSCDERTARRLEERAVDEVAKGVEA